MYMIALLHMAFHDGSVRDITTDIQNLHFTRVLGPIYNIDISPFGRSRYEIPAEQFCVFGDEDNDWAMFEWAVSEI